MIGKTEAAVDSRGIRYIRGAKVPVPPRTVKLRGIRNVRDNAEAE
jgi:hypothetical protein